MVNDTYSIFSLVISMVTLFSVILFNMYVKYRLCRRAAGAGRPPYRAALLR